MAGCSGLTHRWHCPTFQSRVWTNHHPGWEMAFKLQSPNTISEYIVFQNTPYFKYTVFQYTPYFKTHCIEKHFCIALNIPTHLFPVAAGATTFLWINHRRNIDELLHFRQEKVSAAATRWQLLDFGSEEAGFGGLWIRGGRICWILSQPKIMILPSPDKDFDK